jgi:8-oxo-dGTP pyrophosphatase MutT (NUDIX family)
MRRSPAGLALIRREVSGQTVYLVQWNANWQRYSLVGGHKRDDETFRDCLIRELAEELGLRVDADPAVSDQPVVRAEYTCWSESARQETHYEIELFDVTVRTPFVLAQIDDNQLNRWVSLGEIRNARCDDGRPIDASVDRLLRKTGDLPSRDPTATTESANRVT